MIYIQYRKYNSRNQLLLFSVKDDVCKFCTCRFSNKTLFIFSCMFQITKICNAT